MGYVKSIYGKLPSPARQRESIGHMKADLLLYKPTGICRTEGASDRYLRNISYSNSNALLRALRLQTNPLMAFHRAICDERSESLLFRALFARRASVRGALPDKYIVPLGMVSSPWIVL